MDKLKVFLTVLFCSLFTLLSSPLYAENKGTHLLLKEAENLTKENHISHTKFDLLTKKLWAEKAAQNDIIRQKTAEIEEQIKLLELLSDKEGDDNVEASAEIKTKRKKLQNKIQSIDTDIKSSQLLIAKIDDLLSRFSEKKQNALTAQLLNYTPFITNIENVTNALSSGTAYVAQIQNINKVFLTAGLFLFMVISSFFIPHYVQKFLDEHHYNAAKKVSARILLQIAFSAFFILSLRFHIINLLDYPLFRALLQIIFGSILGFSLFEFLGCIDFKKDNNSSQSYSAILSFKNRIKTILRLTSLLTIPVGLLGYAELSSFIALNILSTITAILFFIFTRRLLVKISTILNEKKNHLFSKAENTELSPLAIIIFEPLIAFISLSMVLFFWGVTSRDFAIWIAEYQNGFYVGGIFIDFNIISTTLFIFLSIIAFTKLIQWFLEQRVFIYTTLDLGLQNTTITITGYIGYIIAFLTASNALGLNMANLAIVAGALSVGIGFGLQTIFNNFVSGIILLFERPFKVGDWVTVGGNEGIVKKIKVRSTELETFSKVSLIVPNSVMIGDTVNNFTLHDATGRVTIAIGVAYGSDTEKVKQLLLEAAQTHNNISTSPEPYVLFNGFGDSSLDFELRCFLKNVMRRLSTASDLRFAIDKAFREHNIEIPFPQRDIHIKTKE